MSGVELFVGGQIFEGWESVSVTRGIDRLVGNFALAVSDRGWGIGPGMACRVVLDGEPVLTGYVDRVAPAFDDKSRTLQVAGRGRTADLVDCSAIFGEKDLAQFDGLRLEQIAAALAQPFGIGVRRDPVASAGEPFDTVKINPGETVYTVLEKLARHLGVLITGDAAGDLVITAAGQGRAEVALVEGENVKAARGAFSIDKRFSSYTVLGQRKASAFVDEAAAAQVKAVARDPGVGALRHRPLVMQSTSPLTPELAARLVRHQATLRYGRAAEVGLSVRGWRQRPGAAGSALWRPNLVARVELPRLGLAARDLLVSAVSQTIDREGTRSDLTLVRPEAYDPAPPAEIAAAGDPYAAIRKAIDRANTNTADANA